MNEQNQPLEPKSRKNGGMIAGAVLIVVGIFGVLSRLLPEINMGLYFLPALAVGFIFIGIMTRKIGFIIPGCILAGVGAGAILVQQEIFQVSEQGIGGVFMLCMAAGFLLIIPLSAIFTRPLHWWPVIPSGIMGLLGFALLSGDTGLTILEWVGKFSPAVLILIGIYLILVRRKKIE